MPSIAQLYEWLRNNPCDCAVDAAAKCIMYRAAGEAECACQCHVKIAECHQDRRYA